MCRTIAAQLGSAPGDVLAGLLADIYADPALGDRFAETFLERERLVVAAVLDRAVARGEPAGMPDPAAVQALLIGPVFARLLILTGDPGRMPDLVRMTSEGVASVLLSGAAT